MSKTEFSGLHTNPSTNKLVFVDNDHHKLHDGDAFSAIYNQEVTDIADRSVIAFTTPAATEIHMLVHATCTAASHLFILEGATGTTTGATDLAVYNRDRNSSNESELVSIDATANKVSYYSLTTDTAITGGTTIYQEYIGAGQQGKAVHGASRGTIEWILKKSTVYDIELKANDANTNDQLIEISWYETINLYGGT